MIESIIIIVGLTSIVTMSKLFQPIREFITVKNLFLGKLITCSMCSGFWIGLIVFFIPNFAKEVLFLMTAGSIASEIIYLVIKRLEIR